MMRSLALIALLAVCVYGKPDFCGRLECPAYEVVEKTNDYELRRYEPSVWVSARGRSSNLFKDLFDYIEGDNSEDKKMDMTAPVLMQHSMDGSSVRNENVMSFYMDINNPPQPDDRSLEIVQMPSMMVYVKSYGGWSNSRKVKDNLRALRRAVPNRDDIDFSRAYFAGYDSPWKVFNRHNEVWLVVQQ